FPLPSSFSPIVSPPLLSLPPSPSSPSTSIGSLLFKPVFLTKEQRQALALQRRKAEATAQMRKIENQRRALRGLPPLPDENAEDGAAEGKDGVKAVDATLSRLLTFLVLPFSSFDIPADENAEDGAAEGKERGKRVLHTNTPLLAQTFHPFPLPPILPSSPLFPLSPPLFPLPPLFSHPLSPLPSSIPSCRLHGQYLGLRKPKKRVIKPSEKFRFSFDWENTEDTSRDLNPLYQNPHEAQLLFGRGFRAGVDRREQKKLAAKNEADMRAAIREKEGVEERPEDAEAQQKREEAANAYDTFDMRVDRHWSEKKLNEMTERDWRIFREDFNIAYKGSKVPRPMRNWEESGLSAELLRAVKEIGYTKPSPIQMAAMPIGLQQRDVIGIAETGSGKTCAFVLPMLTYISKLPPMTEANEAEGPYAVVMAPTRELAQQIEEETVKFAQFMNLRVVSIVGGQSIEEQGFKLRQGCEIVIATPGRLLDCLERRYAVLNQCNYVVLDEADRMIDMGFEPQVTGVLEAMNTTFLKPESEDAELDASRIYRVTYMFSATMPPSVERLARKYLRNPVVVTIGTAGKATDLITQNVFMVKDSEKISRLQRLLEGIGEDRTAIVFVNTKKTADGVAKQIDRMGFNVTTLHGGKTQEQREVSLEGFRTKKFNVLVATDVAGRGIDIPDVAHVINFDMPGNIEMYTHRIGRTGRAGKTGVATTFLTLHDSELFYDLKQMLTQSGCAVPPELARHEAAKFKP
ncbi:unnamed protein product, partial [Closterium sp. NIES-65]